MEIEVRRAPSVKGATIGQMFVDGVFECYTLEDTVREPEGLEHIFRTWPEHVAWVQAWKVQNKTAIPRGSYKIGLHNSPHFKCIVPILLDVPGYSDVLIHWGNDAADTDGCILVGQTKEANLIYKSRAAFDVLMPKIKAVLTAGGHVNVTLTHGQVIG
jgi:Steigviridae/Suoliviridae L,D-carboxypeptidase/transpeptidase